MIKFKTLSIKNFLSYGNVPTIVKFDVPGTTLVLGENLDNTSSGTGSNGTGKTTIINALTYALYDTPISNISKDNLVNNINKKNMEVIVDFDVKGDEYRIVRTRKSKAGAEGNQTHLYKNGVDISPDSSKNINKEIEQIIGIPYELFVRIVTFTADLEAFFDLPTRSHYKANQTDIIEELFDLKTLSDKAELLKKKISDTEQSVETNLTKLKTLEKEHERHNTQLESASNRVTNWEKQNKKEIADIESKLNKFKDVDFDKEMSLNNNLKELISDINTTTQARNNFSSQLKQAMKQITDYGVELSHLQDAKCPYCLQQYENTDEKIDSIEESIISLNTKQQTLETSIKEFDEILKTLQQDRDNVESNITISNFSELLEVKSKTDVYTQKLVELKKATNPYIEPLHELEKVTIESVDGVNAIINDLKQMLDHQKFLLKLLTKKDSFVRKALLDKNIPYLNQRLAYYLTELGLPHTVEFTHEMTAQISQFGRLMDFGNLSKGQRSRVNIALSFAFRDVLQSMSQSINVCMLDEVLDVGLDAVGMQAAARMLKRKAREEKLSMFIISHRDEVENVFDRKLTVQISKGFSFIKYDNEN